MINESTAIVPAGPGTEGALQLGGIPVEGPKALVHMATEVAGELTRVIEDRGLSVLIKKRPYVRCEGWTTCAAMLGVVAREVGVEEREDGSVVATVELVRISDQAVVGRGSAICDPEEPSWKGKPRYAIRSMAITRATGKACRLAFSWIITLAGYQGTPAEEVEDLDRGETHPPSSPRARVRNGKRKSTGQRVLGLVGGDRLLRRLASVDRSFDDLLNGLRDHESETYPLCTGVEIADIPAAALDAIGRMLERFAQDRATEPVAAAAAADDISEDDIPF